MQIQAGPNVAWTEAWGACLPYKRFTLTLVTHEMFLELIQALVLVLPKSKGWEWVAAGAWGRVVVWLLIWATGKLGLFWNLWTKLPHHSGTPLSLSSKPDCGEVVENIYWSDGDAFYLKFWVINETSWKKISLRKLGPVREVIPNTKNILRV